ncbi:DNA polymerase zeta catalytic subunit-like [Xenia sp. Carnegie-2017]|uniref:DNA polymerase zeta catalytic subunit-like n=1 Tax=Xenia sp. Carnegie-2017 TaxID=2897299 RepID=UPI001F041A38|nr:DNA polymerase zeta catalytic subunit-like [Xenia sp. Carnegie-2017]
MLCVRIVDADFYVGKPIDGLDILFSKFREANVNRVPVLRIFGSTPGGQKTCVHIHQVFPYLYIPYDGTKPTDKYLKQFTTSVDFAVQVAFGRTSSSMKYVHKTEIVKKIPFYGYHENEEEFIKMELYNPRIIPKLVDLLQNGAILNKSFQPHEAHVPYILQFLIDYNLYGMNLLHVRKVHFRGISSKTDKNLSYNNKSIPLHGSSPNSFLNFPSSQHWNEDTIPRNLCLDPTVKKVSRCELEVDVIAEVILNQINVESCIGHNPGITAMWEDERQQRRDIGLSSQVALTVSQGSDDEHDEDIDEDKESILMLQPFWKDDEEEHDSQR